MPLTMDSRTQPRIEGIVEIRPSHGISAPVLISMVRICLQRRETIHPAADNVAKKHLSTPRRETTDVVGKESLLFRCPAGREAESVTLMDLPFILFIPFGRGGEETNRRIPPASLQLPSRTAETYYELVVTVQQGASLQHKFAFPVPIQRYDTLSTFGMYNRPESKVVTSDNIVTLGISLPRWSYGPLDPITVYIKLAPNPDWMSKARRVTIKAITLSVEEEITYNPEGDEPTKKINKIARHAQNVGTKLPAAGYVTNLGLIFPARDLRDPDGIVRRGKPGFPLYEVTSFTTTSTLYKIEFFLSIKVCHVLYRYDWLVGWLSICLSLQRSPCLTRVPGDDEQRARHRAATAHRDLPDGPAGVQGGDGRHRAGGQGRRPCRREQPHAPRPDHHPLDRSGLVTAPRHVFGRGHQEAPDRIVLATPHDENTAVDNSTFSRRSTAANMSPSGLTAEIASLS